MPRIKVGAIMAWTIEKALEDKNVHLINRNDELGIYEFRIGELKTIITVNVVLSPSGERVKYLSSHTIKTPLQRAPYSQSRDHFDDRPFALHNAINGITLYYERAAHTGLTPTESWLVKN
jgi:hypothetical protein